MRQYLLDAELSCLRCPRATEVGAAAAEAALGVAIAFEGREAFL